jgi:AAA domain
MAVPATAMKQNGTAPPRQNRMTLTSISKGKVAAPYRLLIMGVDGVGKSTFAASAPSPVFLGPELGTNHLEVARFPVPETFEDLRDAVRTLTTDRGEFRTLAIDSVDWIEPLLWAHVCQSAGVKAIEEVGGGYGKGYVAALDQWRVLLSDLEQLQRKQGMNVVLIAHAFIKAFRNPEGEDWDRYTLKMHDKAAALLREWAEGVYFAQFETFAVQQKGKRVKGVSSGARLLYTQRTAAYDAKDRYGLPERLPLSWEEFDIAAKAGRPAEATDLASEIIRKAQIVGGERAAKALEYLERNANNVSALAQLNNRLNVLVAEKAEQEGT